MSYNASSIHALPVRPSSTLIWTTYQLGMHAKACLSLHNITQSQTYILFFYHYGVTVLWDVAKVYSLLCPGVPLWTELDQRERCRSREHISVTEHICRTGPEKSNKPQSVTININVPFRILQEQKDQTYWGGRYSVRELTRSGGRSALWGARLVLIT